MMLSPAELKPLAYDFYSSQSQNISTALASVFCLISVYGIYKLLQVGKRDPRMPPGPPTKPILGNLHQIPSTGLFKQFREWAKEYGPVFSLKLGTGNVIVLCEREAVHSLLDKKSNIYSDRPDFYVGRLLTEGDHIGLEHADRVWREKRKVVSHNFSPKMLDEKHYVVQEAEAVLLLNDLVDDPSNFIKHVRRYTSSVACILVYGQRGETYENFWGHAVYEVMEKWSEAMEPGSSPPADVYGIFKMIPAPLAKWKRRALDAHNEMDSAWIKARKIIDRRRATGERRDCIADHLMDEYEKKGSPFTDHGFNNLLGELVEGGADTTASHITTLILAFALYPEVQKKARAEIDRLCGVDRAPTFSDFDQLPYVNAIVKEGMRWRPTSPTALPHKVVQDDYYKGMLIPKGSTIYLATWAIHHSENVYHDEDEFNPDRYLGYTKLADHYAGSPDWERRDHYGYGAGRRICPGIHMAERSQWRIAAKLLWAFEISPAIDPATKKPIPIDSHDYSPGIAQFPNPFKVEIKPRSALHVAKIKEEKTRALEFLQRFN
ncbi:putative cytochrome P450 oxidoreductase [Myxozyma melibiosi]|uniref:Cytochrome P450 oxidoreductase n=1 Tax=Myxozyma melibiosi TaxID=54550 RepID=A0ABR1FCU3_9ASCO